MQNNKNLACLKCIRTILDIQLGESKANWNELGKSRPECSQCLKELKVQVYPHYHAEDK